MLPASCERLDTRTIARVKARTKFDVMPVILILHHSRDMPEGTLRAILRATEIDVDDFLKA